MSQHQQLIRLDFESDAGVHDLSALVDAYESRLQTSSVAVLSDYGKGTLKRIPRLIELGRRVGKPVFVDPKGADFGIYRGATLMKPNRAEFEAVAGRCTSEAELVRRGERMRAELELEALLITRGVEGMTLLQRGTEPRHFATRAREVFDVTGAGDTVVAVLAAAAGAGCDLAEATALANLSAGIVVRKLGTASVSVPELRRAVFEAEELGHGVVEREELESLVATARARGQSVVMTNGCFDIVHAGHVSFLECAGKLGDRLVVAVNDDASVRRLKGLQRPVHSLEQRMAVLAGLGAVDWVVPFSDDTPERLICQICPDILVKGGDYVPEEIAGADCVRAAGGEVRVLPYIEGYSTTGTIERIRGEASE